MRILVNVHLHYDYLASTICEGLQLLGHEVCSYTPGTNYVELMQFDKPVDLFIQFVRGHGPWKNTKSVMCWGEDSHNGLQQEFRAGFDVVFVRDHIRGMKGIPLNFGIEQRYYSAIDGTPKPLKDRPIDICFLGQLGYGGRRQYVERLKKDFSGYNLELGERKFSEPDDKWSKWTLPWAAHDPRYFETLANSKVCISFRGVGPDTGRHYEIMASGATCLIEFANTNMVEPKPYCLWFEDYDRLKTLIQWALTDDTGIVQRLASKAWCFNRIYHSTAARAAYLLGKLEVSGNARN